MLKRETALATAAIYESMFAAEDGTIPATFQVGMELYIISIIVTCDATHDYFPFQVVSFNIGFRLAWLDDGSSCQFVVGHLHDWVEGAPVSAESEKEGIRHHILQ